MLEMMPFHCDLFAHSNMRSSLCAMGRMMKLGGSYGTDFDLCVMCCSTLNAVCADSANVESSGLSL